MPRSDRFAWPSFAGEFDVPVAVDVEDL